MNHSSFAWKTFLLSLIVGIALGGGLSWVAFSRSAQTQGRQQSPAQASTTNPEQAKTIETMTLAEMTDALRETPDEDFERQYLRYAIQLGNYTTAINRIGKERAERPELQKFTTLYHDTSRDLTRQLFDWQSAWEYTDH